MVGYLLDTNVVSEWTKPKPDRKVLAFLLNHPVEDICLSEVTLAELEMGVASLPDTVHRRRLENWIREDIRVEFDTRLLGIDRRAIDSALALGRLAKRKRMTLQIADALIAATAAARDLIIVTRNCKDFQFLDLRLINPFTGERFNGA